MMRRTTLAGALGAVAAFMGMALGAAAPAFADEAAGHYTLALQYKREGKPDDAIAECEKAISLRPDYAAAHLTLPAPMTSATRRPFVPGGVLKRTPGSSRTPSRRPGRPGGCS